MLERFAEMVAIDAPSKGERGMADYLTKELKRIGFTVTEDDLAAKCGGNAGNLYAYLPGTEGASSKGALFSSHMDTVEPSRGKKAVFHEDGTITSDGTTVLGADDAAGLAAIMEAAESIVEDGMEHPPVEIVFTIGEEIYAVGISGFDSDVLKSERGYVLDLSGAPGAYSLSEPTLISYKAEITGKAAHAGFEPQNGINAVLAAAKAVCAIPQGWVREGTSCNVGIIHGGLATNIVSEKAEISGEIRSRSDADADEMLGEVRSAVEKACREVGASFEFSFRKCITAYRVPDDDPSLLRYKKVVEELGYELLPVPTFGGSDNNELRRRGFKTITMSIPMYDVHSCKEYSKADELVQTAEVVRALMLSDV